MPNPTPDPFAESSDYRKVMREAKIGILMLVMLVGFFMYVVYYRVERFKSQLPQYVLDAPVANLVEPDQYFHQLQSQVAEAKQPVASNKLITASGMIPPMVEKPVKRTAEQPLREKEITVSTPEKKRSGGFSSFLSAIPFGNSEKGKNKKSDSENKQVDSKPEPIEYPVVVASANTPIELPKVTTPHRLERPMQKPKSPEPKQETRSTETESDFQLREQQPPPVARHRLAVPKSDDFTKELASVEVDAAEPVTVQTEFDPNSFSATEIHDLSPTTDAPGNALPESENDFAPSFDTAKQEQTNTKSFPFEPNVVSESVETGDNLEVVVVDPEVPAVDNHFSAPKIEIGSPEPVAVKPAKTNPMQSYVVKAGDSYWAIAQNVYGDGRYFRALFQHNQSQQVSFENLDPGTELFTPSVDILLVRYPELCPADKVAAFGQKGIGQRRIDTAVSKEMPSPSVYETADGETLFEIARRELGQASRYLEIMDLNRENLPQKVTHLTKLNSGIQLRMPR